MKFFFFVSHLTVGRGQQCVLFCVSEVFKFFFSADFVEAFAASAAGPVDLRPVFVFVACLAHDFCQ